MGILVILIILIDSKQGMEIDLLVLNEILSLRKVTNLRNLMSSKAKHHFISQKELVTTTKRDIVNLAHSLNDRCRALPSGDQSLAERWMWGEQKLFIWVLIYYAGASLLDVNAMTHQQFQKILTLFPSKNPSFLRYEFILAFSSDPHVYSQWSPEEIQQLERIYSEEREGENSWKKISYKLYRESGGIFFKPAESCRNRWENHSNPTLKKSPWTPEQDLRMLDCIIECGTRWALVAKRACTGRNEHMIKNRYRSLIKKLRIIQKGKTLEQICRAIIEKADLSQTKKEEEWSLDYETPAVVQEADVAPDCSSGQDGMTEQGEMAEQSQVSKSSEEMKEGLSAAEIMHEVYLHEFGENHRYMASLDDCWLDRIMESHSSFDGELDIYYP